MLFLNDFPCLHVYSTWVMVNLQKRKVAKIPDEMRQKLARFAPDPVRCLFSLSSTAMPAFAAAGIGLAPPATGSLPATYLVAASVNLSLSTYQPLCTEIISPIKSACSPLALCEAGLIHV